MSLCIIEDRRLLKWTTEILLTIFACALQHSLCCSWIYWRSPLLSHPAKKQIDNIWSSTLTVNNDRWINDLSNRGRERGCDSPHLLAGVPIQSRPLQDEPETLPLLGDEDAAVLPLLPQPAITVRHAQLTARHAPSAHGRCHSCKDQIAEVSLYGEKQRFHLKTKTSLLQL